MHNYNGNFFGMHGGSWLFPKIFPTNKFTYLNETYL